MKDTMQKHLTNYVVKENGCWDWASSVDAYGYGQVWRDGRNLGAHRVFYEEYIGPIENLHVLHRCDNRRCVNPEHLFLGTHADNMRDLASKGRHGRSKLTKEQVLEIRSDFRTQSAIAKDYGVCQTTIGRIKNRLYYSHIEKAYQQGVKNAS